MRELDFYRRGNTWHLLTPGYSRFLCGQNPPAVLSRRHFRTVWAPSDVRDMMRGPEELCASCMVRALRGEETAA